MKVRILALAAFALFCQSTAFAQSAATRTYIVQLADEPAAQYDGTVRGLPSTRIATGKRLDARAAPVVQYLDYLRSKRESVIARTVPRSQIRYRYGLAFNGFSAKLTDAQVKRLQADPGVRRVVERTMYTRETTRTPEFLGLSTPSGAWSMTDAAARAIQGEDVIIGILDDGIAPENPAFSDRVDAQGNPTDDPSGRVVYGPPPAKWKGTCQPGEGFFVTDCNNKLIGARYFLADRSFVPSNEMIGPRSVGSHGVHVASTAGGNAHVTALRRYAAGGAAYLGVMSGVAPRARIASYKIAHGGGAFNEDTLAAIEQAVADGVDVINMSFSGTQSNLNDPVQLAYLGASAAGVFVAVSGGNAGPGRAVAHPAPWLTTVASTTHDRRDLATLSLGDGASYVGSAVPAAVPLTAPLVVGAAIALRPNDPDAAYCEAAAIDRSKVVGKIVVCDRPPSAGPETPESDQTYSANIVRAFGGLGVVLLDTAESHAPLSVDAFYAGDAWLPPGPLVSLGLSHRAAILAYAASANARATLSASRQAPPRLAPVAPVMSDFSSRGPSFADASVMKPDIAAPGSDIVAAVAYDARSQEELDAIKAGTLRPAPAAGVFSGTSMSSPHIAGMAALMKQARPGWSPAAIRSAMVTSASEVFLADGTRDEDRWGYGAGMVDVTAALKTDLVYDIRTDDYRRYLCNIGEGVYTPESETCRRLGTLKSTDLNLPSLTAGASVGPVTFRRTITNMGASTAQYVSSAALPGFSTRVEPASISLAPGQSQSFAVTVTPTTAADRAWNFGSLVWSSGEKQVKSPLSAQTVRLDAPPALGDTRATGTKVFPIRFGYSGSLAVKGAGLFAPTQTLVTAVPETTRCEQVEVPAGTKLWRVASYSRDSSALMLMSFVIWRMNESFVASSKGFLADQAVELRNPTDDRYWLCTYMYAIDGPSVSFTRSTWMVPSQPPSTAGQFRVIGPTKTVAGTKASVALSWAAPAGASRYLAAVDYAAVDAATGTSYNPPSTFLEIDLVDPAREFQLPTSVTAPSSSGGRGSSPKMSDFEKKLERTDWGVRR